MAAQLPPNKIANFNTDVFKTLSNICEWEPVNGKKPLLIFALVWQSS